MDGNQGKEKGEGGKEFMLWGHMDGEEVGWPSGQGVGLAIQRFQAKSHSRHLLELFSVNPSSNPRPCL